MKVISPTKDRKLAFRCTVSQEDAVSVCRVSVSLRDKGRDFLKKRNDNKSPQSKSEPKPTYLKKSSFILA